MTSDEELLPRLRVMQLVVGAMMAGVAIFLTIVLYLVVNGRMVALPRAHPGCRGLPSGCWPCRYRSPSCCPLL